VTAFWDAFEYEPVYTVLIAFLSAYPLWGCVLAMFGATASILRRDPARWYIPQPDGVARARARYPVVSVVIPAHNEEELIARAIDRALAIRWPEIDVIVADDGSRDGTREAVLPYVEAGRVRLLRKEVNEGKSRAINDALGLCRGELFLVLDADGQPDKTVLEHMVPRFLDAPAVAAVTGNPRVLNTVNSLTSVQAVEFSSTVGILRRSHSVWGRLMTFSGLCTLLERDAVLDVGGFAADMATEDIDLTWRLQLAGHEVTYEPRALFGMQAPETFRDWWRQRQRWAKGLAQVLRRYTVSVFRPTHWRMWGIWAQCFFSLLWAHLFLGFSLFWLVAALFGHGPPQFSRALALAACVVLVAGVVQAFFGILVDARADPGIKSVIPWAAWFPLAYWLLSVLTVVRATIPGLVRRPRLSTWNLERVTEA
jgi:biofilm PGA synthesis N-glycosyltransferase PgaC